MSPLSMRMAGLNILSGRTLSSNVPSVMLRSLTQRIGVGVGIGIGIDTGGMMMVMMMVMKT